MLLFARGGCLRLGLGLGLVLYKEVVSFMLFFLFVRHGFVDIIIRIDGYMVMVMVMVMFFFFFVLLCYAKYKLSCLMLDLTIVSSAITSVSF